jgi:hypothetical protein
VRFYPKLAELLHKRPFARALELAPTLEGGAAFADAWRAFLQRYGTWAISGPQAAMVLSSSLADAATRQGAGSTFKSFSGSALVANAACAATDSANAIATFPETLHSIDINQP